MEQIVKETKQKKDYLSRLKSWVTPFSKITRTDLAIIIGIEATLFLMFWIFGGIDFMPMPKDIMNGTIVLFNRGLISELYESLKLCITSMLIATAISAIITYLYTIPVTKFLALAITKGRFLPLTGLSFFFTVYFKGDALKTSILVFGITVFFTTAFISYIKAIPYETYIHARTLGLGPWETLYEVIVFGRLFALMEVLIQTFAIAFTMLTLVEGIVRSGGGIGVLLADSNKYFKLSEIMAIQIMLFTLGIILDYCWNYIKLIVAPHTKFEKTNEG